MQSLRLHLRACTVLWLLCQTLSLAALIPTDCCAAHHVAAAAATAECHQEAATPKPAVCPMHGSDGDDCPMHAADGGAGSAEPCAMRGLCNVPASTLAMLIPVPAVPSVAPAVRYVETSEALLASVSPTVDRALPHDTPPPRA